MKLIDMDNFVTFDDVLIEPRFSLIDSRKSVDLSTKCLRLDLPVISANMSTVTEKAMACTMSDNGGLGILHRFLPIEDNVKEYLYVINSSINARRLGVSIGITDGEKERADALVKAGAKIVCIDVAHGAQIGVVQQYIWLREKYPELDIIVGNFATRRCIRDFADCLNLKKYKSPIFKVGIGPGSVCTTRIKTGCGVPQLSAIAQCATTGFMIIADGGMRTPGDIAKALAAGASAVMIGGMLAGTDEAPGEIEENGSFYRYYKGSAADGYGNGWKTSEGVGFKILPKGPAKLILKDIEGGLRSAFTYVGAETLEEFQKKAEFIQITPATQAENRAHYEQKRDR